jgi:hypothetical protein
LNLFKEEYVAWIGGKKNSYNNKFEWINGKVFNYTNWGWSQPNDGDYVAMFISGEWFDEKTNSYSFLCEYITSSI